MTTFFENNRHILTISRHLIFVKTGKIVGKKVKRVGYRLNGVKLHCKTLTFSKPYVNQHIEDPKLRKAAPAQLAPYLNQAAKIRNDESSAIILLKAACFVSDYVDASRSYLNRATKIQNSYDAQILALLLSIKVNFQEKSQIVDQIL
jgi:hypothetical protein